MGANIGNRGISVWGDNFIMLAIYANTKQLLGPFLIPGLIYNQERKKSKIIIP